MAGRFEAREITKVLDMMVGATSPVADSAIDAVREDNLRVLIDVINWCFDCMYDAATWRHTIYGSAASVGERAYAAMLDWKKWLTEMEELLA